jgi:hypothetical protein
MRLEVENGRENRDQNAGAARADKPDDDTNREGRQREHDDRFQRKLPLRSLASGPTDIPPVRFLDASAGRAAAPVPARKPEDQRGDERNDKEQDDSDFDDRSDNPVQQPTQNQTDQEPGQQSTANQSCSFAEPATLLHLHPAPLCVPPNLDMTRSRLTMPS